MCGVFNAHNQSVFISAETTVEQRMTHLHKTCYTPEQAVIQVNRGASPLGNWCNVLIRRVNTTCTCNSENRTRFRVQRESFILVPSKPLDGTKTWRSTKTSAFQDAHVYLSDH